jgi:signal transduction histidine kinase
MICYLYPEPSYLFFISDTPALLYYSHLPAVIIALLVGFFVLINGPKKLANQLLFALALFFSLWTISNLILWTNIHSEYLLFVWTIYQVLFAFISISAIYFIDVFLHKKDVSRGTKGIFALLLLPVLLFAPTYSSLGGFNITNCDAFGFEGIIFKGYYTMLGVIAMLWIGVLLVKNYQVATVEFKKQILLMGTGIEFFLISFFTMTFLATHLANIGVLEDSRLEMFGLFGMMVFMVFIGILIVRFKTFNIGLIASQALVVALVILVGSQFTYITSNTGSVLTALTLLLTGAIGIILMRSVKKEVRQRIEIEALAEKLEKANVRLKQMDKLKSEFVSIASHQLRSPITAISGYASLMREGTYGELTTKMKEPVERIEQSARMMASSIEDYLNVSRIESGNMKYNYADFNLAEQAEHICDDLRSEALKRNLILLFRKRLTGQGVINADIGKVQQIIHNLINNSIKYTQKGSITVHVHDDKPTKKIFIDIIDTGIGMSNDTKQSIFQKFERGDKANSVNIKGTGLGLYVALKMAEAMGGDINAFSEGEGMGSRFTIDLPLVM